MKYAKTVPPGEEMQSAILQVREFVTKTMPAEPVPAAVPAAGPAPGASEGGA